MRIFNLIILFIYFITLLNVIRKKIILNRLLIYAGTNISFRKIQKRIFAGTSGIAIIPIIILFILISIDTLYPVDFKLPLIHVLLYVYLLYLFCFVNFIFQRLYIRCISLLIQIILIYSILYINFIIIFPLCFIYTGIILFFYFSSRHNENMNKPLKSINIHLNTYLKVACIDLFTSSFIQPALALVSLFIYISLQILSSINTTSKDDISRNINILSAVLSVCFYLIVDSTHNINWLFYSLLNPDFKFQLKKSGFFLFLVYGLFFLFIICLAIMTLTTKNIIIYLSFIIFNFVISICISFCFCNVLYKGILSMFCLALSVFLCISYPYLLWTMIFIIFFLVMKIRNEHFWWYKL